MSQQATERTHLSKYGLVVVDHLPVGTLQMRFSSTRNFLCCGHCKLMTDTQLCCCVEFAHAPIGKQRMHPPRRPSGIFYTSNSGIWQTVWLEPVSLFFFKGLVQGIGFTLSPITRDSYAVQIVDCRQQTTDNRVVIDGCCACRVHRM